MGFMNRVFNRLCDFQSAADEKGVGPEWEAISSAAPQGLSYEVLPKVASAAKGAAAAAARQREEKGPSSGLVHLRKVATKLEVASLSPSWYTVDDLGSIVESAEDCFMGEGLLPKSRANDRFHIEKMEALGSR